MLAHKQLKARYDQLVRKSADRKVTSPKEAVLIRKELSALRKQMKRLRLQEEKQMDKNSVLFTWDQSPENFSAWAEEVGACGETARSLIKTNEDIQKFINAWDYNLNSIECSIIKGIIVA